MRIPRCLFFVFPPPSTHPTFFEKLSVLSRRRQRLQIVGTCSRSPQFGFSLSSGRERLFVSSAFNIGGFSPLPVFYECLARKSFPSYRLHILSDTAENFWKLSRATFRRVDLVLPHPFPRASFDVQALRRSGKKDATPLKRLF